MLQAIGAATPEELFRSIPAAFQLRRPLQVPEALTELELEQHMTALGSRNLSADRAVCFLGGGRYDHFIPAVVDTVAGRGAVYAPCPAGPGGRRHGDGPGSFCGRY